MPPFGPWPGKPSTPPPPSGASDWFLTRLAVANLALPNAFFDTVLGFDFAETITTEIVDGVNVFNAEPDTDYATGGILEVSAGPDAANSSVRMQPTGCGSQVFTPGTSYWYMAALGRLQCSDEFNFAIASADAVGVYVDDNNRVTLGLVGAADDTNWVGRVRVGGVDTTISGPAINPSSLGGRWTLFQMWCGHEPGAPLIHFSINDTEFGTIDASTLPATPAKISQILETFGVQEAGVRMQWDKLALIVTSQAVGS